MTVFTCQPNPPGTTAERWGRFRVPILAVGVLVLAMNVLSFTAGPGSAQEPDKGQGGANLDWKEFVDKRIGFRATFPGKPDGKVSNLRDEEARAHEVYNCNVETNKIKYAVQVELRPAALPKEHTKEWATQAVAKWAESPEVQSAREVQVGDYAGFEVRTVRKTAAGTTFDFLTRYYLIGKELYQVYVRAPAGALDDKAALRFLDSFQLLSAAERKRDASDKFFAWDSFSGLTGMFLTKHFMDVGTGWTEYGGGTWRISNKRARMAVQRPQCVLAVDAGEANAVLTCNLLTPASAGMDAGLVVRMVDNDNYWLLAIRDKDLEAHKKSGGNYTSLVKVPYLFRPKTTYRLRVAVNGNRLTAFVNGQQQVDVMMDAFPTATRYGLRDNSAAKCQPSWDNFEVASP